MYAPVPPGKTTRVQSGISQFFDLSKSIVTSEDAVRDSDLPYQSEPADTGLTSGTSAITT